MKKFFIQWRKFESKRICIKKDMNFLFLWNFLEFSGFFRHFLDFLDLILLQKGAKSWGENLGIVAHLNFPISAIESSFNDSDAPRFSR